MTAEQYGSLSQEQQMAMWQQWEAAQAHQQYSYYPPAPQAYAAPMPQPGYGAPAPGYGAPAPGYGMPQQQHPVWDAAAAPHGWGAPIAAAPHVPASHAADPYGMAAPGGEPLPGAAPAPKKAIPSWLQQEILKRKVEAEREAARKAERAKRRRDSDGESDGERGGGVAAAARKRAAGSSRWADDEDHKGSAAKEEAQVGGVQWVAPSAQGLRQLARCPALHPFGRGPPGHLDAHTSPPPPAVHSLRAHRQRKTVPSGVRRWPCKSSASWAACWSR